MTAETSLEPSRTPPHGQRGRDGLTNHSSSVDSLADIVPAKVPQVPSGSGVLRTPGFTSNRGSKECGNRVSFSGVVVVAPPGSPLISDSSDIDTLVNPAPWAEPQVGWIGAVSEPLLPPGEKTCRGWLNELKTSEVGMRLRAVYLVLMVCGIVAIICLGLLDRDHEGALWYRAAQIGVTVVVVLEVIFRIWLDRQIFWTNCGDVLDAVVAFICVAAIVVTYLHAYTRITGTRSEEKYFAFAMRVTRDTVRLLKLMMQLYYLPY